MSWGGVIVSRIGRLGHILGCQSRSGRDPVGTGRDPVVTVGICKNFLFLSWLSKDTEHIYRARMKLNNHMIFIATILLHAHRHWLIAAASYSLY